MTNTGRALTDIEIRNICGGNFETHKKEYNEHCYCFNIGDVVEVYTSSWEWTTRRGKIVDRKWDDFMHVPVYRIEYLEDCWYSFLSPEWISSNRFE